MNLSCLLADAIKNKWPKVFVRNLEHDVNVYWPVYNQTLNTQQNLWIFTIEISLDLLYLYIISKPTSSVYQHESLKITYDLKNPNSIDDMFNMLDRLVICLTTYSKPYKSKNYLIQMLSSEVRKLYQERFDTMLHTDWPIRW